VCCRWLQVNSEDYDGWLPLHVACYYGAATVADMMLRRGVQVSCQQQQQQDVGPSG
jgi:ankyrin repeat protein